MVLPAVIKNGERELKVNVMLDPCSTGSYVTEAAEELQLNGETYDLTISGTGGSQVKKIVQTSESCCQKPEQELFGMLMCQRLEQYNWRYTSFQLGRIERQVAPFGFSSL